MASFIKNSTDYNLTAPDVALVRHAVQGQASVKRETTTYLPHPNMLDTTSAQQKRRYSSFIARAEFDSACGQTKTELVGAFTRADHEIDLPAQVKYLESDSDGDWLSLSDSINVSFANCLEAKFHIILAEFEDGGVDASKEISKAEKQALKQRAKIVHYPREALTSWNFKTVNGRMQLSNACLTTTAIELDENFAETKTKTQILLGLDENGFYRQKKLTQNASTEDDGVSTTGWIYPMASGSKLDYIPIEIITDERTYAGKLPMATGYLSAIAQKDIARYQVNADLKEKLAMLQDTINTFGWTEQSWETFKTINGRDFIATGVGVSNQFSSEVTAEILKMSADGDAHFKYIEENQKQTRALGGRYETEPSGGDKTVVETQVQSAKENAVLTMLAVNLEQAYRRAVAYCCQFEGVELLPEDINISVNKQFSSSRISPDEARSIKDIYEARLIDQESAAKLLKAGGYGNADLTLDEVINAIDDETPPPVAQTGGAQTNVEVQQ